MRKNVEYTDRRTAPLKYHKFYLYFWGWVVAIARIIYIPYLVLKIIVYFKSGYRFAGILSIVDVLFVIAALVISIMFIIGAYKWRYSSFDLFRSFQMLRCYWYIERLTLLLSIKLLTFLGFINKVEGLDFSYPIMICVIGFVTYWYYTKREKLFYPDYLEAPLNLVCPSCGAHIEERHRFCGVCGRPIDHRKVKMMLRAQGQQEL